MLTHLKNTLRYLWLVVLASCASDPSLMRPTEQLLKRIAVNDKNLVYSAIVRTGVFDNAIYLQTDTELLLLLPNNNSSYSIYWRRRIEEISCISWQEFSPVGTQQILNIVTSAGGFSIFPPYISLFQANFGTHTPPAYDFLLKYGASDCNIKP
jgi:hypothetical protein